jgi:hypothetical protein
VATQQNQLVEWDLATNAFVHDEVISWEADLPERMRGRQLFRAWFSPRNNLLAAVYKGHDLVLGDCTEKSL